MFMVTINLPHYWLQSSHLFTWVDFSGLSHTQTTAAGWSGWFVQSICPLLFQATLLRGHRLSLLSQQQWEKAIMGKSQSWVINVRSCMTNTWSTRMSKSVSVLWLCCLSVRHAALDKMVRHLWRPVLFVPVPQGAGEESGAGVVL